MKKIIVLLMAVLMLLGGCGVPSDTTVGDETTEMPETQNSETTELSENTDIPDVTDCESVVTEVKEPVETAPEETDPPIHVERFDHTIAVKEDTYVLNNDNNGNKSDQSFHEDVIIDVKSNKGSLTRYGYVKFDISSLKGDNDFTAIDLDLTLTWRQKDAGNPELGAIEIYGCDTGWKGSGLTFNTQPACFERVCIIDDITTEKEVKSFPVTDYVRKAVQSGKTEIAFYIKEATPDTALRFKFASSESGEGAPQLSVYYGTKVDDSVYEGKLEESSPEVSSKGLDAILGQNKDSSFIVKVLEDTYVEGGSSSAKNFGSAAELDFKAMTNGVASNYYRVVLLKFNFEDVNTDDVGFSQLTLNCTSMENSSIPTTVHVYACDSSKWSENTVTYENIPEREDLISTAVVTAKGLFSIDVTDYVNSCLKYGDTEIGFYLEGDQDSIRRLKFSSKESGSNAPKLVCSGSETNITTYIRYTGENPWEVAMNAYNEWINRWEVIKKGGDDTAEVIQKDSSEYSLTVDATRSPNGNNTTYKQYPTRTVDTLKGYTQNTSERAMYDVYGGLMDDSMKQESTGFFYTKKIGDRWWTIDPLGYPFFRTAVVTVSMGNKSMKAKFTAKYGGEAGWAQATTDRLRELGFNSTGGWSTIASLIKADEPLAQTQIIGLVGSYASSVGLNVSKSGSTDLEGNVLPVFDPDFASYVDSKVSKTVSAYANSSDVYGWMSDNELPDELNMLDNSMLFNPDDSRFAYSYAMAWTYMYMKTGKSNVSLADVTDELRREYRAMVYDKLFSLTCSALDKYDPNHMYMGCRFINGCFMDEYVLRVAGYWCDVITFNYYGVWEPNATVIANIQKYAGKPFVITEWYAKGMDVWEKDNRMTNQSGAGWTVRTQNDRGLFYQNYALQLLECKGCVGFDWFKFLDNDPDDLSTDLSNRNANKGIISNDCDEYTEVTEYMNELNSQKYNLIRYFDAR